MKGCRLALGLLATSGLLPGAWAAPAEARRGWHRPPSVVVHRAYPVWHPYPVYVRRGPSTGEVLLGALVVGGVVAAAAGAGARAEEARRREEAWRDAEWRDRQAEPWRGEPWDLPSGAGPSGRGGWDDRRPAAGGGAAASACAAVAEASAGRLGRVVSVREAGWDRGVAWVDGEVDDAASRQRLGFSCAFDGERVVNFRFT